MKSLNQFVGNSQVFKNSVSLPPFFESNLVDPTRVVKQFLNDPQAHIKIFYYQYLRLCFELDNVNYDFYIRKIEEIINSSFHFIFYSDDDPAIFNDTQAKSLIMQFFGVLGEGQSNVQKSLTKYPIMDSIFVHFFRSLLILMEKATDLDSYIPRDDLLGFLCPYFGVEVEIHNECIKYVETDIFVYELNPAAVYMAYMDYQGQEQQQAQASYQPQVAVVQPMSQPVVYDQSLLNASKSDRSASGPAKDSYIAGQFMDYTAVNNNQLTALTSKAKVALKQSGTFNELTTKQQPSVVVEKTNYNELSKPIYQPKITPTNAYPSVDIATNNFQIPAITKAANVDIATNKYESWQPTAQIASKKQVYVALTPNIYNSPVSVNKQSVPTPSLNQYVGSQSNQYQTSALDQFNLNTQINSVQTIQSSQYNSNQNSQYNVQAQNNQYGQFQPSSQSLASKNQIKNDDLLYNPKKENTLFSPNIYSPKIQVETKVTATTTYNTATKKKNFGLNVSDQFTNSLTMKSMAEPHRSNVQNMRNRARNFRSSLTNFIK